MKLLGIDYGSKKIGLAISDEEGRVAFPRSVIKNNAVILSEIQELIKKEKIEGIVLGESLAYSGEPNLIMKRISVFKESLEKATCLPVSFENEFLSSKQARNIHDSGELNDASAAAIILQSYLDKLKNRK
ncbi:MAG: Holliday junction resolvase RuvX [Candidatus Paceibacterota bacterium]|jgi:putative Holliday junction resolvase|nr:Holliday junction resolvase RuvX [Candidatus Paceibacterota bacterium]